MKSNEYYYVINEENAPERLKGQKITAIMTEDELSFRIDLEEEPNAQEAGYLKWFLGELVDRMKEQMKDKVGDSVENLFGLPRYSVEKQ